MQCPKCHSDHTQKLSVIHDSGTRHFRSRSLDWRDFGGTSTSALARKMAPPAKKSTPISWFFLVVVGISLALFAYIAAVDHSAAEEAVFLTCALIYLPLPLYRIWRARRYNTLTWPGLYRQWADSWLCHKCGTVYHQPDA
jgi:hypothetical protein